MVMAPGPGLGCQAGLTTPARVTGAASRHGRRSVTGSAPSVNSVSQQTLADAAACGCPRCLPPSLSGPSLPPSRSLAPSYNPPGPCPALSLPPSLLIAGTAGPDMVAHART